MKPDLNKVLHKTECDDFFIVWFINKEDKDVMNCMIVDLD